MHPLVIVIPAFKPNFFRDTLASLAAQTDPRFRVYVGNDGGPEDFEEMCADFPSLDLEYHRYERNLGSESLPGHWNRCIEATDEPWVWLFSDDDVAGPDCVAAFYERLEDFRDRDVMRFQTQIIGSDGQVQRPSRPHPPHETGTDFLFDRLLGERDSFVVEYVFRREAWKRAGGFADFPAAWCADDVAWFSFSRRGGITTLDRGVVSWRASGVNITDAHRGWLKEKLTASGRFLDFVRFDVRDSPGDVRPPEEWDRAVGGWFAAQLHYLMPLPPGLFLRAVEMAPVEWRQAPAATLFLLLYWTVTATFRWLRGRVRRVFSRPG